MSRGTAGTVPPARGVQLVLIVGVAAAEVEPDVKLDMKLDVAAGVVRLAVWDTVEVAVRMARASGALNRLGGGGEGADRSGGVAGSVCRVIRSSHCHSCGACSWCFSLKGRPWTLRSMMSSTRQRGWCSFSWRTSCMLELALGV